ncbi:MAG: NAD(P)/FAD-dependent oxidoreductase [Chitinophagaceae bacterium]|nr:NAD(P)/FAD-dependent oxidoreductase [Chitinophagaceae bacterium]
MIETAICIIGAGPAGTTTSLFLSKFNIPHIIVDAQSFPRDKICGDALDLKVMRILNQLEPNLVEKEILHNPNFTASNQVVIHLTEKKKGILTHKATPNSFPYFFFAKRNYFDNYLVQKINPSYATFLQNTRVEKIEETGAEKLITANQNGTTVQIKTKFIVGADGQQSVVLKYLGNHHVNREHYSAGLRQYWHGLNNPNNPQQLELYLPKSLPFSYLWIFPLPNGEANVGCGLLSSLVTKNKVNIKHLLNELITNDPVLKERFKYATPLEKPMGWGLPLASLQRKASGKGWLLVGDAASLICPTTGEGIGPGMMSGMMAAHFLQRAYQENDFSENKFTNYDREIYKYLQADIKNFNRIKATSPLVYNFFINTVATNFLCRWYFKKNVVKWINTAYTKKIQVNLD